MLPESLMLFTSLICKISFVYKGKLTFNKKTKISHEAKNYMFTFYGWSCIVILKMTNGK